MAVETHNLMYSNEAEKSNEDIYDDLNLKNVLFGFLGFNKSIMLIALKRHLTIEDFHK